MDIITAFIIAVGLAMDCFSVSIVSGMTGRVCISIAFKLGASFGLFQMFMPLLGWFLGKNLIEVVSTFDHWLAFGLLSFVGCKMIYESFQKERGSAILNFRNLLMLSTATSIDAFSVGIVIGFLTASIMMPILIFGLVTFILSFLGTLVGDRLKHILGRRAQIIGGAILILIGIEILLEHVVFT
ncbi:MAG: manganese efflux pump MntP family protein [Thaumarchaeota archaeon]|jgi:putative Mn2+ efflux pump MntP|nr:manganese efflux pump MntP family protein [Candidatus Terraquivivens yellowstonensis]MCL7392176.1 manganese efflux pump MntP family protein [Candidatus Terraquivivens yellowstonensis]MCL7395138.1 manganese efflux pump MntP family protein [Candidatus Terraquivivens yellowstonensis]MCL7397978.1 manganese efflux pump MntP family protein [Candidatus Terraquivivens yellowstonensis]MCL7399366.1 manganese efflux pump MntP family protein [Candidatus Terraquivivens yellowstonensis]